MDPTVYADGGVGVWDIARPPWPRRMAGVSMAGFRDLGSGPVDVRVVPHPDVTLAFGVGDGPLLVDAATGEYQRGNLVVGFMNDAFRVRGENVECVQVRLSPVIARAVLGVSPAELDRTAVALDELWGDEAEGIRHRLGECTSWEDRFALVEEVLASRCETAPSVDPEVAWCWSRILTSHGGVRVEDLAADVGWSRKRLWTRFRGQIGLPPKPAAQLVRFDRAVHHLAGGVDAARVAADGGYVDQSHLHREVRAISGTTPAALTGETWLAADNIAWSPEPKNQSPCARFAVVPSPSVSPPSSYHAGGIEVRSHEIEKVGACLRRPGRR